MRLTFTIEAIDKATARVRGINKTIAGITKPIRQLGELSKAAGIGANFDKLTGQLRGLRTGALYVAGTATAAVLLLKRLSGLGDQAVNTAQRVGMTVEAVQRLNFAAEQNGSNAGEMSDGLKFINRNAVAAATGSQEAATWFRRAGISVKDANGKIKPTGQLLGELADRFEKMPDGPKKTALAMGILGRSGESLIPTLNLGRKGIEELAKKAEWLGIVMDKTTAQGLDDLGDNMDDVGRATRGVFIAAIKPLLPMLNALVKSITAWLVANRALIAGKLGEFIKGVAEVLPDVWEGIKIVATGIGWLLRLVHNIAQLFGGWKVVIVAVAAIIAGKLVFAIAALTKSVVLFGIALLTTPVGWFLLAVGAIAGAAFLIYKNWEPIKGFFSDLWTDIKGSFSGNLSSIENLVKTFIKVTFFPLIKLIETIHKLLPEGAFKSRLGAGIEWLNTRNTSASPATGTGATQVGGTIKIEVDGNGKPRVTEVKSDSSDVDLEVDTGYTTAWGY